MESYIFRSVLGTITCGKERRESGVKRRTNQVDVGSMLATNIPTRALNSPLVLSLIGSTWPGLHMPT